MKRMRYALGLILTTALALLALPAQAAEVTTTVTQGPYAEAFFSTLPTDEPPTPGVVYEDVYVFGAEQATPDTGGVPTAFALIDVFQYTVTDSGDQILVSDTFGGMFAPDVTFTVGKKLATASLTATFDTLKQITPANPGGGPVPGGTVSMTWTATGPTVRVADKSKAMVPGEGVWMLRDHGTYRDGTATGTALGASYTSSNYADIANGKTVERLIAH